MAEGATASVERGMLSSFDVVRAMTVFFEDPEWIPKLVVGSFFAFLCPFLVGIPFVAGYGVGVAKRTFHNRQPALPPWEDFQEILRDGLRGMVISFVHKFPLMIFALVVFFALVGGVFLARGEGTLPEEFMFVGLPALFGGVVVMFLLSLAILVYLPSAFVRFVQTDRLLAAFEFTANASFIRAHLTSYLIALLAIVLSGFIAQFGFFVFCLGVFPASFYSVCVTGSVIGELARLAPGREPTSKQV